MRFTSNYSARKKKKHVGRLLNFFWNGTFSRDIRHSLVFGGVALPPKSFFFGKHTCHAMPLRCYDVKDRPKGPVSLEISLRWDAFFLLFWVRILRLRNIYENNKKMLKFNNSSTKFLKNLSKRWCFFGVLLSCPWLAFFQRMTSSMSNGWNSAPLNWTRDVSRDVRQWPSDNFFSRHVEGWILHVEKELSSQLKPLFGFLIWKLPVKYYNLRHFDVIEKEMCVFRAVS